MGSTWQFNTIRELLKVREVPLTTLYIENLTSWSEVTIKENENFLIKSHFSELPPSAKFPEWVDIRILISFRNVFDTIRSARRVFTGHTDDQFLYSIKKSLGGIKTLVNSGHVTHISFIDGLNTDKDLLEETLAISQFLGLESSYELINKVSSRLSKDSIRRKILNELKLGSNFEMMDLETHWHGNHIAPSTQDLIAETLEFDLMSLIESGYESDNIKVAIKKLEDQTDSLIKFLRPLFQQRDEIIQQRDQIAQDRVGIIQERDNLLNSTIWKVSKPIRWIGNLFNG